MAMQISNLTNSYIRINKPSPVGIIVAALQVIQAGLAVVDITPVTEWVGRSQGVCQGTGAGKLLAPGIVGVRHDGGS